MKSPHLFLTAALATLTTVAGAQTLTVAKSGTPDHSTIQAAISALEASVDPAPNVIHITDSAVYDEIITINKSVTIEGTGANRPIITVRTNTTANPADPNDGLSIFFTENDSTVTLRNLIVLPSTTDPPADDIIRSNSAAGVLNPTVILDNILVTANDGFNNPVSVDGLSPVNLASFPSLVHVGDDCIFLSAAAGAGLVAVLTNVVATHNQNGGNADCLVLSGGTNVKSVTIGDGCVFSYNGRVAVQANAGESFIIDAPNNPVRIIGSKGFAGLWFAAAQSVERSVNGLIVADIEGNQSTFGWGVENQNRGTITGTFSNMIISNCFRQGFLIGSLGTGDTVLNNVTIAKNGTNAVENSTGSAGNMTINDSIIGGNGGTQATEVINNAGSGTITVNFSAVVTAGPQSLNATPTLGTVNLNNVVNADPQFDQTTDFVASNYYYSLNAAYVTAGTGGTRLGPAFPTSARDWQLF